MEIQNKVRETAALKTLTSTYSDSEEDEEVDKNEEKGDEINVEEVVKDDKKKDQQEEESRQEDGGGGDESNSGENCEIDESTSSVSHSSPRHSASEEASEVGDSSELGDSSEESQGSLSKYNLEDVEEDEHGNVYIAAPRNGETRKRPAQLVSYNVEGAEDSDGSYESEGESRDRRIRGLGINDANFSKSPVSFHRSCLGVDPDSCLLPPEPTGRCSKSLQEKMARLYEKKIRTGIDMNATIQKRKDFRNPSIYEKLIAYLGIDELGTNYPPELYDPHSWGKESFHEELAKRQKEEMEKREKERKERIKVEVLSGTAKKPAQGTEGSKKHTKWDASIGHSASVSTSSAARPVVPSSVPSTAISAFAMLSKQNK